MSTNRLVQFIGLSVLACLILFGFLYFYMDRPNKFPNGFVRKFDQKLPGLKKAINLEQTGFYFAGSTDSNIYLSHFKIPTYLLRVNTSLTDTSVQQLILKPDRGFSWEALRMSVDSPNIYLIEGVTPKFFYSTLSDGNMKGFLPKGQHFDRALEISPGSFIAKGISSETRSGTLLRIFPDSPYFKLGKNLLVKQVDGIFCTEGIMKYDRASRKIFYVYAYRNEFLAADTNLNLLFRGHTIDTTKFAKVKISDKLNGGEYMHSAPPPLINIACSIYDDKLYVVSNLKADNETRHEFFSNNVIDVYSTTDGRYLKSIYLPRYKKKPLRDLIVLGNKFIAMYEFDLCMYQYRDLNEPSNNISFYGRN